MNESGRALVLIIEDDADLVKLYEIVLGMLKTPPDVAVCRDGRSGLARVETEPKPKVILLDLHLPHVEGVEIFKRAREHTDSFIVVVTADVLAAHDMFGLADHVFIKPLDIQGFMEIIRRLL
jgi:two-component system response regulator BaeR